MWNYCLTMAQRLIFSMVLDLLHFLCLSFKVNNHFSKTLGKIYDNFFRMILLMFQVMSRLQSCFLHMERILNLKIAVVYMLVISLFQKVLPSLRTLTNSLFFDEFFFFVYQICQIQTMNKFGKCLLKRGSMLIRRTIWEQQRLKRHQQQVRYIQSIFIFQCQKIFNICIEFRPHKNCGSTYWVWSWCKSCQQKGRKRTFGCSFTW